MVSYIFYDDIQIKLTWLSSANLIVILLIRFIFKRVHSSPTNHGKLCTVPLKCCYDEMQKRWLGVLTPEWLWMNQILVVEETVFKCTEVFKYRQVYCCEIIDLEIRITDWSVVDSMDAFLSEWRLYLWRFAMVVQCRPVCRWLRCIHGKKWIGHTCGAAQAAVKWPGTFMLWSLPTLTAVNSDLDLLRLTRSY